MTKPPATLFPSLVEGVVGFCLANSLLACLLLAWAPTPRFLWRQLCGSRPPWDTGASLFGAAWGLSIGAGLAFGAASYLAARGRGKSCLWVLCLAPVSVGGAVYGASIMAGMTPAEVGLEMAQELDSTLFWGAVYQWVVIALCVGGALLQARARAAPPRLQATASALGGCLAFALLLPTPWRSSAPGLFGLFSLPDPTNARLFLCFGPGLLLPPALWIGSHAARKILRELGQPVPRPDPLQLPPRGEWFQLALRTLRTPQLGALVTGRLRALPVDHAPLLRPAAVILAWAALTIWLLRAFPFRPSLMQACASASLVTGSVAVVWFSLWRPNRWPVGTGLLVGGAPLVTAVLVCNGARGAAALVSALILGGLAGRIFPLIGALFLLAAWPSGGHWWPYVPLGAWPRSAAVTTPVVLSLVALVGLWLLRHGKGGVRPLLGLSLGAVAAGWLTHQWVFAASENMLIWLFAREASLLTGVVGGALGSWAGRGPYRRSLMGLALVAALTIAGGHALRGDIIEALPTRRVRQAAESGDPEAMLELAQHLEVGLHTILAVRRGEESCLWYQRAAGAGNAEAMYRLALRLEDGRAPMNRDQALLWLERAAEAGHALAGERRKEFSGDGD